MEVREFLDKDSEVTTTTTWSWRGRAQVVMMSEPMMGEVASYRRLR